MTNQLEALISRAKHIVENGGLLARDTSLALIAALEQSQRENDDLRQRHANSEHQLYMAELAKNNLRASRRAQFHKRRSAEKRIAEFETSQLAVKLPDEIIDQVCMAASEIHNRGNGVDDDKAQFIIDRIRNYLESGAAVQGDG